MQDYILTLLCQSYQSTAEKSLPIIESLSFVCPWTVMMAIAGVSLLRWMWWIFAVLCLLGTSPVYFAVWFIWKCVTLALPRRQYELGDEFLYALYQKMVLFFCQYCSGVEVGE